MQESGTGESSEAYEFEEVHELSAAEVWQKGLIISEKQRENNSRDV